MGWHLMDTAYETRQYRRLAWRMRLEAKLMDRAAGKRVFESARLFEQIAEKLEHIVERIKTKRSSTRL
jgi:hypothetical protein